MKCKLSMTILLALIFYYAKGQHSANTTFKQPKIIEAFGFYKLDDKYSDTDSIVEINNWVKEKTSQIQNGKITGDVFLRNGPGPNGAQWNPGADLYIAVAVPVANTIKEIVINVNDIFFKRVKLNDKKIKWIVLKESFWYKHLRKIRTKDVVPMYGREKVDAVNKGLENITAGLDYGEVIKFSIVLGKDKIDKYFHATYGE